MHPLSYSIVQAFDCLSFPQQKKLTVEKPQSAGQTASPGSAVSDLLYSIVYIVNQ